MSDGALLTFTHNLGETMKTLLAILLFFSTQAFAFPVHDTCEVPLVTGWNLVGAIENVPVHAFFNEPQKIVSVWKWDSAKAMWAFYTPQLPEGGVAYATDKGFARLYGMKKGEGVWINASEATTFNTCMDIYTTPPMPPQ